MKDTPPPASPVPMIGKVTVRDIFESLFAGWYDFKAAPIFGCFFSLVYVIGGFSLVYFGAGTITWTLVVSLGFPLVAPFAAVGLYEVSRRLEANEPLIWKNVLKVVLGEKDRQLPWMGAIIVIYFLFWTFIAHMVFALFMGPSALVNISSSYASILTPRGFSMIGVEIVIGGIFAFLLFCVSVVSFPLLVEREIDFVSAMLLSIRAVRQNFWSMLLWAVIIAVTLLLAMLPWFLGLFIALPLLGHATWHLYRRTLYDDI